MITVIVEVQDGCVQSVVSTLPDEVNVVIVDYDEQGANELYAEQYRPGDDRELDELLEQAGVEL